MAEDKEKGKINLGKMRQQNKEKALEEERAARRTETQLREEQKLKMEAERQREAASPRTERQKKTENFMYHHKSKLIAGVFILILAAVFVKDIFFTPKTDMVLVMAGSRVVPAELSEQVVELMTPAIGDLNEDGKTLISVDAVLIPSSDVPEPSDDPMEISDIQGDPQAEAAGMMKLMAVVSAGKEHLYLLDTDAFNYLTQGESESGLFEPLELNGEKVYGIPLPETVLKNLEYADYLEDFKFYVRVSMKPEEPEKDYVEALRIIEELKG